MDVEVFMWDGWNRATRLGFLSAGDTTRFPVPQTVTSAGGPYYLEARTAQGSDYPHSELFALRAGDKVAWSVPSLDAFGAAPDEIPADTAQRDSVPH